MRSSWTDYPIGIFIEATRTTVGGILLAIFACVVGMWLPMSISDFLDGSWNGLLDSFRKALLFPIISLMGIACLYGIPFILVQWVCFYQIVWLESNLLHRWFIIAYCQFLLLAFCTEGKMACYWDWKTVVVFALTLLVLGGLHFFLAWVVRRQNG